MIEVLRQVDTSANERGNGEKAGDEGGQPREDCYNGNTRSSYIYSTEMQQWGKDSLLKRKISKYSDPKVIAVDPEIKFSVSSV